MWLLAGSVDAVLTPYYAILKVLGGLRLPSLIAMVLTSIVVVAIGRRVSGDTAGLLAGSLFAVLPVTSRYAQEARPYALVMLFAALALLALLRLLEEPSAGRAAVYAGAVALTGLAHPLSALLMLAGHALAGWQRWRVWTPAAVLGSLPAIGLCLLAAGQTAQVSWIAPVGVGSIGLLPAQLFVSAVTGGLLLALAVTGLRRDRTSLALAGAALVPPVLLLVAGTVADVWVARYVLFVIPALAVLAVRVLHWAHALPVVLLIAVLGYPAQLDIREPDGHGQDSARVANLIGPRYRPGDVVVFPDTHVSIPWAARDLYDLYVPEPRPKDVLAVTPQRTGGRMLATECPDVAACLGAPPRIWIVRVDNTPDPLADMAPAKRAAIKDDYRVRDRWSSALLTVVLMERTGTPLPGGRRAPG
ncbi:glycosyltransferase family 39 protein [Actinoplanes couchii]|uniref:Glycosyltransferase RgtA/B/C/D-like domain-containing protein n=1 Tax=Actinoplanes couchii TaxID=403638 RepID=A0ABQ3X7X4_9ACTN|nr:glycosyltransferase family 39 protein [Actinoplanes couchii]MDR6322356.1 mannosyltransferase [Actinoplanes couchii]GID54513.1 hypothetical protein Aco03nite_029170 [Actinoplanes couchii]